MGLKKRKLHKKWLLAGILLIVMTLSSFFLKNQTVQEGIIDAKAEDAISTLRLGYAQTMEYSFFAQFLLKMAEQMEREGSIEEGFSEKYVDVNYEEKFTEGDTKLLWDDICAHNPDGAKYQFVQEAFFDMDTMKEKDYETMVNRDDVDLMFAMGTMPGVYMKEHETKNKYMVIMAADPIASGIVKSETERYTDNAFAQIDNHGYNRQIEAGYKFLKFKKLGIVYEDTEEGKLYAALDIAEEEAEKCGFEVLTEAVEPMSEKDQGEKFYRDLKKAYRKLIDRGMDTLYITTSGMDYEKKLHEVLSDSILPNKIKTLGQDDMIAVMSGALFGVSLMDMDEASIHIMTELKKYVDEGVPFQELDQVNECTPRIYMNMTTAKEIDFHVSFQDLLLVDKIYQ